MAGASVDAITPFVPGSIWAKIKAGDAAWVVSASRLCKVTLLFLRFEAVLDDGDGGEVAAIVRKVRDGHALSADELGLLRAAGDGDGDGSGDGGAEARAYATAVAVLQEALYKIQGTFKHFLAGERGGLAVAAVGLPPFEQPIVASSQGAVSTAIAVRAQLAQLGVNASAVVLSGAVWIGSAGGTGAAARREYVMLGECMQLGAQMLRLASDEQPVLVDGHTFQANKTRFDFGPLPVTVSVWAQLRHTTIFALRKVRRGGHDQGKKKGAALPHTTRLWCAGLRRSGRTSERPWWRRNCRR